MENGTQHVFLIGSKSIGAYGGYETFVDKLTEYHKDNRNIKYHIACKANGKGSMSPKQLRGAEIIDERNFVYHGADCFLVKVPDRLGPAQSIYYDMVALSECCRQIEDEHIENPIVYIMACRIGPVVRHYYNRIHRLGGRIYLNPDGHEWKRRQWSAPVSCYWKLSEKRMVKYSDRVICDSVNIESYIHEEYDGKGKSGANPVTTYVSYGAEIVTDDASEHSLELVNWLAGEDLKAGEYYLVVGRFVPENNYETMIREFMNSHTKKKLVIITGRNDRFMKKLQNELHFTEDERVRFVGTVYNKRLLMKIRKNAYGYIHGHEVGGTNPSLLEALGSTELNLLLDVSFNREVAEDAAFYWNKDRGNLAELIDRADEMSADERERYGKLARQRIKDAYSWQFIADRYEEEFLGN